MKKTKFLVLAVLAAMFVGCQSEEPEQISENDRPSPTGDTRIIIEGEGMLDTQSRSSDGRVDFTGGYATGAGLYNGSDQPMVAAYPNAGYEVSYFYGGPASEPKKYDYAQNQSSTFNVDLGGQDHTFHCGFKEKKRTLTVNAGSGGKVSPSGTKEYQVEKPISITATPNSGYEFSGWSITGGDVTIANPNSSSTTATLNSTSGTITANFSKSEPTIPTYELYIEATPVGDRVKLKLYINYGGELVTTWPFKEDNLSFKINLRDRSDASKRFELSAGSINYSKYSCSGTTTYSFECASGYNFKSPYVESVVFNSQPDGAIVKFIQR